MRLGNFIIENYYPWRQPAAPTEVPWLTEAMNIEWTSQGFRSAYGHRVIHTLPAAGVSPSARCDLLEVDGEVVVVNNGYLAELSGNALTRFACRYEAEELECEYKWSNSCVGCENVLSHPGHPLVVKDMQTGVWKEWCSSDWNSPIYGSACFGNRLFVLLEDTLVWSDIDNPCVFSIDKNTGSGFQSLNLAKFGKPLGLFATASALYTFTTNGIMRTVLDNNITYAEGGTRPILGAMVFRHEGIKTEALACSPCAIRSDGNSVFWHARQGFYTFDQQGNPSDVSAEFSSYLREKLPAERGEIYVDKQRNVIHIKLEECLFITYDSVLQKWGVHDVPIKALVSNKYERCPYFLMGHYFVGQFNNTTRTPSYALTSSLRAPLVNLFDVSTREIEVNEIEAHEYEEENFDYECALASGTGPKSAKPLKLSVGRQDECLTIFCTRVKALYHAVRFTAPTKAARFHITGLSLNGRFAGVNRK